MQEAITSPLFFIFAETLVGVFKIAFGTFLLCIAAGLLIALFRKDDESTSHEPPTQP